MSPKVPTGPPSNASDVPQTRGHKLDLHTHYYPEIYFQKIRELPSEFSFDKSPSGQTIITYRGARFFGVTPPMTDVARRIDDMDRVGIDVEVVSLSTPNVFFAEAQHQLEIARMVNDAYAELVAMHPARFKAFASIPMDSPDEALQELHRAINELKSQVAESCSRRPVGDVRASHSEAATAEDWANCQVEADSVATAAALLPVDAAARPGLAV